MKERNQEIKSKGRLDYTLDFLDAGVWELDLVTQKSWRSIHHDKIFGYDELLPEWTYDMFLEHVVFDDKEMVNLKFNDAISNKTDWTFECRIVRHDGCIRWILAKGTRQHNKDEEPTKMFGVVQDITERKIYEEKIKDSEEKYKALYEKAPLSYQSLNSDGTFRDINPSWLHTLGYNRDEVIGKKYVDFLHPDWQEHFNKNFPAFKKRGYVSDVHFKIRHKSGHYLDISFEGCIGYNKDGSVRQTYCVFQDITKRLKVEAKVKESEERFRLLYNNSPDMHASVSPTDSKLLVCNDRLLNNLGYSREEVIGYSIFNLYHNDCMKEVKIAFQQFLKTGLVDNCELALKRKDGSKLDVSLKVYAHRDENGKILHSMSSWRDISEQKIAKKQLQENQNFNESLLNTSPDLIYIYDLISKKNIYSNRGITKILGYSIDEIKNFGDKLIPTLMDKNDLKNYLEKVLPLYQTAKDGELVEHEYRMRHKNGNWCWLHSKESIYLRLPDGSPKQIFGIISDVTERKHSLEELKKSEKQQINLIDKMMNGFALHEIIYNNNGEPYDYRFIQVNPAWEQIVGFDTGFVVNKKVSDLILKHEDIWLEIFNRVVETGIPEEFERFNSTINKYLHCYVYRTKPGQFAVILNDITEKKKINEKITFQAHLLESIEQAVIVTSPEGIISFWNLFAEKLYGWASNEVLGKNIIEVVAPQISKDQAKDIMTHITAGKSWSGEFIAKKHDNSLFYSSVTDTPIFNTEDKLVAIIGISTDISVQKRVESALIESEERFRAISENAPILINSFNPDGKCLFWNDQCEKTFGWTMNEINENESPMSLFYPDPFAYDEIVRSASTYTKGRIVESQPITKDGNVLYVLWTNFRLPDGQVFSMGHDITDRKKIEKSLEDSYKLLEYSQSIAKLGAWELDIETNKLVWTTETYSIYETSPEEFTPDVESGIKNFTPSSRSIITAALEDAINNGKGYDLKLETFTTKGRLIQVRTTCEVTLLNGKPIKLNGILQDITEQIKLTSENESLAKFPSENPNPVIRISKSGNVLYANQAAELILDFWNGSINNKVPLKWENYIKKSIDSKEIITVEEDVFDRKFLFSIKPIMEEDYINLYARDITERVIAEESLIQLKTAIEKADVTIFITDDKGLVEYANPYFEDLTGYSIAEITGKNPKLLKSDVHSKDFYKEMWETINSGQTWEGEFCNRKKNGELYWEKSIITPIINESKQITNYVAIKTDISADKKIEEQLRQSQKMDAIGQLAGGVAHDFNNMLTGIMGCAELISSKVPANSDLSKFTNLILDSSMQAAELTHKLLTFSRKGDSVHKVFDIHESILKSCSMLERSIDKSIVIKSELSADHTLISGDLSLIENSFLNLGINARDVMPKGGELTFSTRNIHSRDIPQTTDSKIDSGLYIEIDVRDTGSGMTPEVRDRLFEPFFTTKSIGKGTGLGLSIVYNTIKENNGFISIYSELGFGSLFKIFLPVIEDLPNLKIAENHDFLLGNETVLVADDESIVRVVITKMLSELGYNVITASDGEECIEIYKERESEIDLVILDMIMPKLNGKDVFYQLKLMNSDIKAIICSGFSKDISIQKLIDNGLSGFIQKPYSKLELSVKIREAISKSD